MPSEDKSSKTEKATPKKRKDEAKKGNIPQSRDVPVAVSIFVMFFMLKLYMPYMFEYLSLVYTRITGMIGSVTELSLEVGRQMMKDVSVAVILCSGPLMAVAIAAGVLGSGVQTKFKFYRELIKPKFSKLNPISGIKNLFSGRSLVELLKSIIKIAVILYLLYNEYKKMIGEFPTLMSVDILHAGQFIVEAVVSLAYKIALAFCVIAAADYFYQRWEYERNIRMTKQEIKEEYKQVEGDPKVKGQIKERQRKISMQRMMQQVPTADVVVRNPTHFAVALKYDIDKNVAPIVVAKGQDHLAFKIIEIAEKNNIPLKEDRPLARALYDAVDVGREIPPEFYSVVANLMAWVYQLKNKRL